MTSWLFQTVLPPLGYGVIRLLGGSMRLATRYPERPEALFRRGQNVIIAFWHGRGFLLPLVARALTRRHGRRIYTMVSQHRDGEVISRTFEYFGGRTVRGSTTRGGSEALRQMVQLAREGADLAITPDGPVGPSGTVHPGVIEMARLTGLPIVPLSVGVSRGRHLGSWDRFLVPAPFARGLFIWGEPIWVDREVDPAIFEQKRMELKTALDRITEEADRDLDRRHRSPLLYLLYELVWVLSAPVVVLSRVLRVGRAPGAAGTGPWGLRERFGRLPSALACEAGGRRPVWIHAASLGEVTAAAPVAQALTRRYPDRPVVMSAMTATGRRAAEQTVGPRAFYLPLDLRPCVRRAVRALRPALLLLVETELWPNLIRAAAEAGVPVVVISGRISPGSYRWGRLVKPFFAHVLGQVARFLMQSEPDADRVIALGADPGRVTVCGDIKSAAFQNGPAAPSAEVAEALIGRPVWVVGSLHAGEIGVILEAYRTIRLAVPGLRLVLAPRYLEEVAGIEQACEAAGWPVTRRSRITRGQGQGITLPSDTVMLLDSHGELAGVYSLAAVAFVGGTLVPVGGHNLLEPAIAGCPVLFGPYIEHVEAAARALLAAGGGISVRGADDLAREVTGLLQDDGRRKVMGEQARTVVEAHQGALDLTLTALTPYMV